MKKQKRDKMPFTLLNEGDKFYDLHGSLLMKIQRVSMTPHAPVRDQLFANCVLLEGNVVDHSVLYRGRLMECSPEEYVERIADR